MTGVRRSRGPSGPVLVWTGVLLCPVLSACNYDTGAEGSAAARTPLMCYGWAGCACAAHSECNDGACIETPEGRRCAARCTHGCPEGRVCRPVFAGADAADYCVPRWGLLCRPCDKREDCAASGLEGTECVDYGGAGGFCGAPCVEAADCPEGYLCRPVVSVEGSEHRQCVRSDPAADFGTCPCTDAWAEEGVATSCRVPRKDEAGRLLGRCRGERRCTASGLSACEKLTGAAAACTDVQCDGRADGSECDDGDPCTESTACRGGRCTGTELCACRPVVEPCPDDGDPCNGEPYCDTSSLPYTCKPNPGTVVHCDDTSRDTACRRNGCDAATGECALLPVATLEACDDGDPCTTGDRCDGKGSCAAGANTCPCQDDAGCAKEEDGDLCNGTLYCDRSEAPYQCRVNPATIVHCPTVDDTDCLKSTCDAKTGACAMAVQASATCDDGDPCTAGDLCDDEGRCRPGGTNICPCTKHADCAGKDDGDFCNGTPYCDLASHTCRVNPATVVYCPTVGDTACLKNVCAPGTGACIAKAEPDGTACDDGGPCTANDLCKAGRCEAGKTDICQCQTDGDCTDQDDGDLCNGTLYCELSSHTCRPNPATVVHCQSVDDTVCRANRCAPKTGKCGFVSRNELSACEADGNPCTQSDHCEQGKCVAGANLCECAADQDCAPLDDGDPCNGVLYCDRGGKDPKTWHCRPNPASVVKCAASGAPCVVRACMAGTGKCVGTPLADGLACEDGHPCTGPDTCQGGACKPGGPRCACGKDGDCDKFDDGVACNGVLKCAAGKCKGAAGPGCDDGNACTDDACDKGKGCTHQNNTVKCDDGSLCTPVDACEGGKCVGVKALSCDDGNACTVDLCSKALGCVYKAAEDGGKCEDGSRCTMGDRCQHGTCAAGKAEQCPGTTWPCHTSACNAKTGACRVIAQTDGTACASGKGVCSAGACVWTDGAGRKWGLVPPGTFWMGCNAALDKGCGADEKPQHPVTITKPFWLGLYEVTVAQYKACVDAGKCTVPSTTTYWCSGSHAKWSNWPTVNPGRPNHPVNCVTWGQSQTYCNWAGGTLPTEAQWALAARGRCQENGGLAGCMSRMRVYPWGNASPVCGKHAVFGAGGLGCGKGRSWVVGTGSVSGRGPYGHYDLAGNVWEWARDWYSPSYYQSSPPQNPVNTTSAGGRVVRGGSMLDPSAHLRASHRAGVGPASFAAANHGLRCARPFP